MAVGRDVYTPPPPPPPKKNLPQTFSQVREGEGRGGALVAEMNKVCEGCGGGAANSPTVTRILTFPRVPFSILRPILFLVRLR